MRRVLLVLALFLGARAASAACELQLMAEIPADLLGRRGLRPVVSAIINGAEGRFLFDTGASAGLIAAGSLAKFGLSAEQAETVQIKSFGKLFDARQITTKELRFAAWSISGHSLVVIDQPLVSGTDGALGEAEMTDFDMEIDLPHRAVRFYKPSDCSAAELAYWAKPGQVHHIELDPFTREHNRIFGPVSINGATFRALFDTGASDTGLTRQTAETAGVHPGSEGVTEDGQVRGVGPEALKNWKATFTEFAIGGETVAHPVFGFSDKTNASADLIVGADFFKRHRVYVAKRQHVMAFTDEGTNSFGIDWDRAPNTSAEAIPAATRQ